MRLFSLVLATLAAAKAEAGPDTIWGVNGHPFSQSPYYDISIGEQLDLVSELGVGWYRVDLSSEAFTAETGRLDELLAESLHRGIRILPVLVSSPSGRSLKATPQQIHDAAFTFGRTVADRYRGRITHWELDNELDTASMIGEGEKMRNESLWYWGAPDGSEPGHYQDLRYLRAKAEIQGFYDGIKSADPGALTIVDTSGWLHYGFVERLVNEDHVPFDVLAWHWYSEMGDITHVEGKLNLVEKLKTYGKPLWITEVNRRDGSSGGHEAELAHYMKTSVNALGANRSIGAVFEYELLDEPYVGDDTRYGLLSVARDTSGRWRVTGKKEAFYAFRSVVLNSSAN
jgi:hypothetical protein